VIGDDMIVKSYRPRAFVVRLNSTSRVNEKSLNSENSENSAVQSENRFVVSLQHKSTYHHVSRKLRLPKDKHDETQRSNPATQSHQDSESLGDKELTNSDDLDLAQQT